jgi:glycosyltransferase involved in cell wall biosynthesis
MISIIIPTLNEEKYLPKLLRSIKEQDFKEELEIIVADANSEDKTREIAKKFSCKIVEGGLPAKARNEGAKIAKGDFLLFIDADISLPKDFLRKILAEIKRRDLGVAGFYLSAQDETLFTKLLFAVFCNIFLRIGQKIMPMACMVIFSKKNIHKNIHGFDEEIKICEDVSYARDGRRYGKFGIIKSTKPYISTRRFKKDGWIKPYLKYLFANVYILIFGPIKTNIFNYKFNHYDK